jgi:hypothetical protein
MSTSNIATRSLITKILYFISLPNYHYAPLIATRTPHETITFVCPTRRTLFQSRLYALLGGYFAITSTTSKDNHTILLLHRRLTAKLKHQPISHLQNLVSFLHSFSLSESAQRFALLERADRCLVASLTVISASGA